MKFFLKIFFLFFFTSFQVIYSQNIDNSISTNIYLIRHAEKDRTDISNKNPHLSDFGIIRSKYWNQVLKNVKFDKIYSTNLFRTKETALPLAESNNLELVIYNQINYSDFLKLNFGNNVLIVGHSNTIPIIANSLIGFEKYDLIDDHNNSNVYIVTIGPDGTISDKLLYVELNKY